MVENSKDNKELAALEENLNRLGKGSTRFSNVTKVGNGQYQMLAHLNPNNSNHSLLLSTPDEIKNLVKARKAPPNSLLAKVENSSELKELQRRIYAAGARDIARTAERGGDLQKVSKEVETTNRTVAALDQRFRDTLSYSTLDLLDRPAIEADALELYERSEEEYLKTGQYGTTLDLLSNFAATGFHNEIAEQDIREYYDAWVSDTDFFNMVIKIFSNLFMYSVTHILPAQGDYEPHMDGISSIPGKEPNKGTEKAKIAYALKHVLKKHGLKFNYDKFNTYFKKSQKENAQQDRIPVAYTILDPKYVKIESSGIYGGETLTVMRKGLSKIKEGLERVKKGEASNTEKERLKLLPTEVRRAVENDEDYIDKKGLINTIYLRKQDFEAYSKPRGTRAFDSFDYKEELKKADIATVDGIFNYILKVTIGNDENPVTDVSSLASLAEAFNTPQKAMTVVWNHTLQIEKITSNEVGAILGIAKYEPVNKDITAALGVTRALIDGDSVSAPSAVLSSKAIQSEISLARSQVTTWIYKQYRQIAVVASFAYYPAVRWAQSVITTDSDAVTRSSWMQMVDRQLVSRKTAMKALGLDPTSELERLKEEVELIAEGIGIQGSPFQQSPDQGRPVGQPTTTKKPVNDTKVVKRKTKTTSPSQQTQTSKADNLTTDKLISIIEELPDDMQQEIIELLTEEE